MNRTAIIVLLMLVTFVAGAAAQSAAPLPCRLQLDRPSLSPSTGVRPSSGISAMVTDDVTISVLFPTSLTGDHLLTLNFLTPRGHLYQSMVVPISDTPRIMQVPGHPHPVTAKVPAQVLVNRDPFVRVPVVFPVGGTSITANSIYGTWTVVPILDNAERPCGNTLVLEITP